MWYRTEFDFNVLFIHLRTRKTPFNALVFSLRSKVELNWTSAIRHVIAQSVEFSKIAKKLLLHMLFFTEAILLCAVRDAQCKTRESP